MFYCVETWDSDEERFTPQEGVHGRHLTLMQLRRALRLLSYHGYDVSREDGNTVLVYTDTFPLILREELEQWSNRKPNGRNCTTAAGSTWT